MKLTSLLQYTTLRPLNNVSLDLITNFSAISDQALLNFQINL